MNYIPIRIYMSRCCRCGCPPGYSPRLLARGRATRPRTGYSPADGLLAATRPRTGYSPADGLLARGSARPRTGYSPADGLLARGRAADAGRLRRLLSSATFRSTDGSLGCSRLQSRPWVLRALRQVPLRLSQRSASPLSSGWCVFAKMDAGGSPRPLVSERTLYDGAGRERTGCCRITWHRRIARVGGWHRGGAGAQGRAGHARYVDWQNVCQLHCSNVTRSTGAAEHAAIRPLWTF